jgi:hypothetical protein
MVKVIFMHNVQMIVKIVKFQFMDLIVFRHILQFAKLQYFQELLSQGYAGKPYLIRIDWLSQGNIQIAR